MPPEETEISPPSSSSVRPRKTQRLLWLDAVLFLVLFLAALPLRFSLTQGDLWGDEADYAIASQSSFGNNRWDRSPDPKQPELQVRLRHYHAPLTVYLAGIGAREGDRSERSIRTPAVIAGALTVGVVYLCGIPLFGGRRELALGCALMTLVTPMHLRASSHALPWAYITLLLMTLLWTLLAFAESRRPVWVFGSIVTLSGLFLLSEFLFPTLLAVALAAPVIFARRIWTKEQKREIGRAAGAGGGVLLLLGVLLWPAGLLGGAFRMLFHYTGLRNIIYPVNIGNTIFNTAPKWAYFYWYYFDYKPYFCLYAAGTMVLIGLAVARRLTRPMGVLAVYTLLFLGVAHKAHIIGPEYLVHCLPMLSLVSGFIFYGLSLVWRPAGGAAFLPICLYLFGWQTTPVRREIETKARVPRWPGALKVLKPIWKPGDKLLVGPQTVNVVIWYLKWAGGLPLRDGQIGQLPPKAFAPATRERIEGGYYRFLVVSSAFSATPHLSDDLQAVLRRWKVIHRSAEPEGLTQLTIYEYPGKTSAPPSLPAPQEVPEPLPEENETPH